jgi:hypothetical protein
MKPWRRRWFEAQSSDSGRFKNEVLLKFGVQLPLFCEMSSQA